MASVFARNKHAFKAQLTNRGVSTKPSTASTKTTQKEKKEKIPSTPLIVYDRDAWTTLLTHTFRNGKLSEDERLLIWRHFKTHFVFDAGKDWRMTLEKHMALSKDLIAKCKKAFNVIYFQFIIFFSNFRQSLKFLHIPSMVHLNENVRIRIRQFM